VKDVRGKTAVVSAAGAGIGRALAKALAAEGMNVALLDIRPDALAQVLAEMPAGGRYTSVLVDVAERASVKAAADAVEAALGDVHLLCSNAGVIDTGKPLYDTPDEMFDWMMNVNPGGTFNMIKAFVPRMRRQGQGGHVTITSSTAGLHTLPGEPFGAYCASKMAVVGLAEDLRDALAADGIGVSAVCPGRVYTNAAFSGRQRQARFGGPFERAHQQPIVEAMDPADAAKIIIRGIRENAPYIFTRPADRVHVERRYQAMMADFDRWERIIPELQLGPPIAP